ncbi:MULTISPECIES: hypothetical protein [unclassified Colwellia]|uniref:hypothetical protein n=1 Tax=unclassified Colwellia TaxID=196834 RepID=UPI0015F600CD|nr:MULTISPECIES: hypothetical protein [unclassified Colwellia]MBA6232870.1 hypothetical protein [Colwellia sp. MB02u-7]MBA6237004.1 hypothetical protein [Colwellia sp. MB02u-11]MBA6299517.1 hypothetical protein [Colwellia sp. MB3u-22]MBA6311617.1 hypothetical protein [Colwellia sp. MB3u-64]
MTVMAHPNIQNVKRYRIQDKVFGIQEYFSIAKHGDKAKILAEKRQEEISQKRLYRQIRMQLDINKIFHPDGTVIGLKRTLKNKNGSIKKILHIQISVNGKQKKTDITIDNKTFEQAYLKAQNKILELRKIEHYLEITEIFKKVAGYYKYS